MAYPVLAERGPLRQKYDKGLQYHKHEQKDVHSSSGLLDEDYILDFAPASQSTQSPKTFSALVLCECARSGILREPRSNGLIRGTETLKQNQADPDKMTWTHFSCSPVQYNSDS